MANIPGVPERFKVVEIQRTPRTEPPDKSPFPGHVAGGKPSKPPESAVIEKTAHGWKFTAPVALLVAVLGVFAGRSSVPASTSDPTQALVEMRAEMRGELRDIKREQEALRRDLRDRDNTLSNRLNAVEARLAARP